MKRIKAAAIQIAPSTAALSQKSIESNVSRTMDLVMKCVKETNPDLIVLPETVTTGFVTGKSPSELWDLIDDKYILEPFQNLAKLLSVHIVHASYSRGEEKNEILNSSWVLLPDGSIGGKYNKTHPFCTENVCNGGWVTAGTEVCVTETQLGKIGMVICFDGDFPELSRIQALMGAEIIARPSALLRSADIWELTTRARAYDNHVFFIGANAIGSDPQGTYYFGNSMIVDPIGTVIARATSHESWITAILDPDVAMNSLSPGSSVAQPFDHLNDRNLELLDRYSEVLKAGGSTSFNYSRPKSR